MKFICVVKVDEKNIVSDCNKLFNIMKCLESYSPKKEEEILKHLYRIILLTSNRQNTKSLPTTYFAVKYICNHPVLPTILVEIIRCSKQIKITTYVLEILFRLIVKNNLVQENDRKAIRKVFWNPINFKQIIECVQLLYVYFGEDNSSVVYEMQLKLFKVINCLYMRKGHSQTSLVTTFTIQFIGELIDKYKNQKDMFQSVLPVIKIFCRNRKYCDLLTSERFFNSLTTLTPIKSKLVTIVTILKLMSRNAEAAQEMSKCEKVFSFILNTLNGQVEKTIHKKYLMTVLYKITKTPFGMQYMSKLNFWNMLLEFLIKNEKLDEQRIRLIITKGYTILHRGVNRSVLQITPLKLDLRQDVQRNYDELEDQIEDSDNENEDSDFEDENNNKFEEPIGTELSEEDCEGSELEEQASEDAALEENIPSIKYDTEILSNIKIYFQEFSASVARDVESDINIYQGAKELLLRTSGSDFDKMLQKMVAHRVNRNDKLNNLAFPDMVKADCEVNEDAINALTNCFSTEDMIRKLKNAKGLQECEYRRKVVYQLDALLRDPNAERANLPNPDTFKQDISQADPENVTTMDSRHKSSTTRAQKINRLTPTLHFESRFECGNLRCAEQIGESEYNLFLTPDINLHCGLQWFYFQVSNMIAEELYTFNIVNFQKVNSQFNYGMQPVVFSAIDYVISGTGWNKAGERIVYHGNELTNNEKNKQFRTLSFSITFPYNNDYCYFAYHYPYTYSRLMMEIFPFTTTNPEEIYSRVDKLCTTVNCNEVPLITITSPINRSQSLGIPYEKRFLVFITARVHPCESNSSWIMDGILQFLLDEQDERAINAREHYIFKIIPMLNPEGVVSGNTRCGLTGSDLNRCWKKPHPVLHPEIYYAKKLVQYTKQELKNNILTFIDIHGHSRKKFFFFYGCNPKQSWNDNDRVRTDSSDISYHIIPKVLSSNENMKPSFCRYNIERKRESTCRVVMWREFGIKCSYTLECSYCSGENKKKMTVKMLRDIGISIISSLATIAENSQKRQL